MHKTNNPNFLSIRNAAKVTAYSERKLREMAQEGKCPGFRSGNRFVVNVPLLLEQLDAECRRNGGVAV